MGYVYELAFHLLVCVLVPFSLNIFETVIIHSWCGVVAYLCAGADPKSGQGGSK